MQQLLPPNVRKHALREGMHGDMVAQRQALFWHRSIQRIVDVEYYVEYTPHMEIVQIVLDKRLLQATDQAARRARSNRSALVREALREHLRRLEVRDREERDRQGYSKKPQAQGDALAWEAEAVWPPE